MMIVATMMTVSVMAKAATASAGNSSDNDGSDDGERRIYILYLYFKEKLSVIKDEDLREHLFRIKIKIR